MSFVDELTEGGELRAMWKLKGQGDEWERVKRSTLVFAFFNFFVVALTGLFLRSLPFWTYPLDAHHFLHGHSHFAFGGWLLPLLSWAIMQYLPGLAKKISPGRWMQINAGLILSAWGMLLSFPFQGYGPVSIAFSTASLGFSAWMAWLLNRASRGMREEIPVRFLRAGLFYLLLSAMGPFALGPLSANGLAGSAWYFDAIYFFLHFQYNGWFIFALLAVGYAIPGQEAAGRGRVVFYLMHAACLPAYFLSMLWHKPGLFFHLAGGMAAVLQLGAFGFLLHDLLRLRKKQNQRRLLILALAAFGLKLLLQLLSAFPLFAALAATQRPFVIAYLHLVLLGVISLCGFAFAALAQPVFASRLKSIVPFFLFGFISTELLLVASAFGAQYAFVIPHRELLLFLCSLPLPVFGFLAWRAVIGDQ